MDGENNTAARSEIVNFIQNNIKQITKNLHDHKLTKVSIDNSVYRLTINEKNKKQLKKGDSIKLKKWNRYVVHSSFPFLGQSSIITLCLIGLITFYFKNKK